MAEIENVLPESIVGNEGNSEIFRLAAELGKAISVDARMERLRIAKENYEKDEKLSKIMGEYDVQQAAMQQMATDPDRDTHLVDMVQSRINELYEMILASATFQELLYAQEAATKLTEAVNNTITYMITGETPDCTHDCSTCGGACHH